MRLVDELIVSGALKALWDRRLGTLRDLSGSGNHANTIVGTPRWVRSEKGDGIWSDQLGSVYTSPGNPASLWLLTGTIFTLATRTQGSAGYQGVTVKPSAFDLSWNTGAEPKAFGTYDTAAGAFRASTFTCYPDGRAHFLAMSFSHAVVNGTQFYADGAPRGTATLQIASHAQAWRLGLGSAANDGLGGIWIVGGIVNRVLTLAELARLNVEMAEPLLLGPPNRIAYSYPSLRAGEYAAKGIVLDSKFEAQMVGATRRIRDETGNYPGTIGGVPVPGPHTIYDDAGLRIHGGWADYVDFGNVTQTNGAVTATFEGWIETPPANMIATAYWLYRRADATHLIQVYTDNGSANPNVRVAVCNGAATSGLATGAIRSGCKHHICLVYDGNGATDADKCKLYIDRDLTTLAFAGPMPATLPNLPLNNQLIGNNWEHTSSRLRIHTPALSAAQVSDAYLEGAKHVIWQAPGEDVPVSLVASVGAGVYLGPWRVVSGTWKISEDATGKRWLECVTAGAVVTPQPFASGTWTFEVLKPDAGSFYLMFAASAATAWNDATQNGYCLSVDANERVDGATRITGGAAALALAYSANGYETGGVSYSYVVNRRNSDGRFTIWLRGGAFANWTVLSVAGGGGSNPTAAESTYFTSAWMTLTATAGVKLCIHDPTVRGWPVPTRIHLGALDPTAGEMAP